VLIEEEKLDTTTMLDGNAQITTTIDENTSAQSTTTPTIFSKEWYEAAKRDFEINKYVIAIDKQ
jgi:hypothetical protein